MRQLRTTWLACRWLLLQLLLLPVLCVGQTISLVSRATGADGVPGDAASGTSVYGYVRSPVTDAGDVFLLSLAQLDGLLDGNFVRDVYRRSGTTTSVVSISEYPPDLTLFGSACGVGVSAGGTWAVTLRPANDIDAARQAFLWDLTSTPFSRSTLLANTVDVAAVVISGSGLFVGFATTADGVVAGDGNGKSDVFLYSIVNQTTVWASARPDGTASNGNSYAPAVSESGSHVVFLSNATNLVGAGATGNAHVIVREIASGSLARMDERIDGTETAAAQACDISGDGAWVVFASPDDGIVAGDANGVADVFLRGSGGGATELVSVATDRTRANAASGAPAINRDGRFVVFTSTATNLAGTETHGRQQIYLRDRSVGTTVLLSRSATGDAANSDCFAPAISPSGRYVTFASAATNLVGSAGPVGVPQVFLVDRGTGCQNHPPEATVLAAATSRNTPVLMELTGTDPDADPLTFVISVLPANGKLFDGDTTDAAAEITSAGHVVQAADHRVTYLPTTDFAGIDAFVYRASDPHGASDIASATVTVGEPTAGIIRRISEPRPGGQSNGDSARDSTPGRVGISHAGDRVCYGALAPNLDTNTPDSNSVDDIFLWDAATAANTLASVDSGGAQGGDLDASDDCAISPCGRYVAFVSLARLSAEDTNDYRDVYLRDAELGSTILVSRSAATGQAGNGDSTSPSVSEDGLFVTFASSASDLTGEASGKQQVYLWRRSDRRLWLISARDGTPGNGDSVSPVLSASGNAVAFASKATNLGVASTGESQVFVWWLDTGVLSCVSLSTGGSPGNGDSATPSISGGGRYVAFQSAATDLVLGDVNGKKDIFVRDLQAGTTALVSASAAGQQTDAHSYAPAISGNGRSVYFRSRAANLTGTATGGVMTAYLRDMVTGGRDWGEIFLVSHGTDGTAPGNGDTWNGAVSGTGRYVAFASDATNLVWNDTNGFRDVFLCDLGERSNAPPTSPTIAVEVEANHALVIELVAQDPDGDDLVLVGLESPAHGQLSTLDTSVSPSHTHPTVRYTPHVDYVGDDTFTFSVSDGATVIEGQISVTVTPDDRPPELTLSTGQFVMATGVAEGTITQELFEVTDPDDPNGPGPTEIWIEILSEPVNGVLLDKDGFVLHQGDSVLLADFPLTYRAHNAGEFASEVISFRAFGNDWTSASVDLEVVVGAVLQTLTLKPGWNLISFKMDPLEPDPAVLFASEGRSRAVGVVWFWETDDGRYSYNRAQALVGGLGYWVFIIGDEMLIEDIPGSPIADTVLPIFRGWNLIGPVGDGTERDLPEAADDLRGPAWYWDTRLRCYRAATRMDEGVGYWLYSGSETAVDLGLE